MKKLLTIATALMLVALMLVALMFTACGSEDTEEAVITRDTSTPLFHLPQARTLSIFRTEGESVTMSRAGGRETSAQAGTNLHQGDSVSTAPSSFCHILLDRSSLIKMDENSLITFDRVNELLLSVVVEHGQIFVDVQGQESGQSLETRIGNVAIGVRGTLFVAGWSYDDQVQITMLEGSVETDTMSLYAGSVTRIQDDVARVYELSDVLKELDEFILSTIWDYQERILEAEAITYETINVVAELLGLREPEAVTTEDETATIALLVDVHEEEPEEDPAPIAVIRATPTPAPTPTPTPPPATGDWEPTATPTPPIPDGDWDEPEPPAPDGDWDDSAPLTPDGDWDDPPPLTPDGDWDDWSAFPDGNWDNWTPPSAPDGDWYDWEPSTLDAPDGEW